MPPPEKPKKSPDDLAEVERALSVLKGRHPGHVRAQREDQEQRSRRRSAREVEDDSEQKKTLRKRILIGGGAIVFGVGLGVVGTLAQREVGRRDRVEKAVDPYRAQGFTVLETSDRASTGKLDVAVEPGCILAVSTGTAPIKITRPGGSFEGASPALFCPCENEKITVTGTDVAKGGLAVLRTDAATIGGARAFPYAQVKPGVTSKLPADDTCSEASFDAWLEQKHFPTTPADDKWMNDPKRVLLAEASFKVAASAGKGIPFAVVEMPKESCLVATSSAGKTDKVGLRAKGGTMLVADAAGGFAWCAVEGATYVVSREGSGDLTVLLGSSAVAGGISGTREVARSSGVVIGPASVPANDHAWTAKALLLASALPESMVTVASVPDVPEDPEARIVAVSFATPNALRPEVASEVFSYCEPTLDENAKDALCIFSDKQSWKLGSSDAVGGLARAKLPHWLTAMKTVNDPVAMKAMSDLFKLTRRLKREGFEPTPFEALTELPTAVEVLGRSGEDAVVAIAISSAPPFVFAYTDGAPWALDGAPRIVNLKPLDKVMLQSTVKPFPKGTRRTVVFRRPKK